MTKTQYQNIIRGTMRGLNKTNDDSLSKIRAIMDNCGVPLPKGDAADVVSVLATGEYMGWEACTAEEARERVENGIPAVGYSAQGLTLIIPEPSETESDPSVENPAVFVSATAISESSLPSVQFYSYSSSTATTTNLIIDGKPSNNKMIVGDFMFLTVYQPSSAFPVYPIWTYDSTMFSKWDGGTPHHPITTFHSLKPGTTTITASYNGFSSQFFVTVKNMQIYISPANHTNVYTKPDGTNYPISEWNEKKNMEIVGGYLAAFFEEFYVDIHLTNIHVGDQYYDRPEEARDWITNTSKGLYLSLHSNAAQSSPSNARGATAYYNIVREASSLSQALANAINLILPNGSNRSSSIFLSDGTENAILNFGELRLTGGYDIPAIILEPTFHDNPTETAFLIANQQLIANTIGETLVNFYNLIRK